MRRLFFAVSLITLASLALEVLLTKAFDIMLTQGMAYMVITAAVFAFGLAGVYGSIRPLPTREQLRPALTWLSIALAASVAIIVPAMNWLPFDFWALADEPLKQLLAFLAMYLVLVAPFFITGYILVAMFEAYADDIQEIYFWDLVGAGLGTIVIVPFIPMIGPGGLVFACAGLALLAAALFSEKRGLSAACIIVALAIFAYPFLLMPEYLDFDDHMEKRWVKQDKAAGKLEVTRWDPVSKIEVIDRKFTSRKAQVGWIVGDKKHIAYDGGNQSSFYYPFDGNLAGLRAELEQDMQHVKTHFWQLGVLASHYLKRDSDQDVLIVGAAGGQETKAALMYGAGSVRAVELVAAVLDLGQNEYSPYIGEVLNHPAVEVIAGEGRSYLRQSDARFDIIQIFSNHTSSSIAQGNGALSPAYLQTVEAYLEYFAHLKDDGLLHINHHYYPRMITTAAKAWHEAGGGNFQDHVAVFTARKEDALPTMLISMQPWTPEALEEIREFLQPTEVDEPYRFELAENPVDHSQSFLSAEFYDGSGFSKEIADMMPVRVTPRTDNNPYFSFVRRSLNEVEPSREQYVTENMANMLNLRIKEMKGIVPLDILHLLVTSVLSLIVVILFVLLPLRFSALGRERGARSAPLLVYFSCLGAGFIIIELIFIQKFMHLIGSPVATYATVIFSMLLSAGVGSLMSKFLRINPTGLWYVPFGAIVACGAIFIATHSVVFDFGLNLPLLGRAIVAAALIFPIGFFLGMPFPLGVLALESKPRGSIPWAWGMNGVFTVVGGLLSVILGALVGFTTTLWLALLLYLVALATFPRLRAI